MVIYIQYLWVTDGRVKACTHQDQIWAKLRQKTSRVQINNLQHVLAKCEFSKMAYLVCDWQEDVTED